MDDASCVRTGTICARNAHLSAYVPNYSVESRGYLGGDRSPGTVLVCIGSGMRRWERIVPKCVPVQHSGSCDTAEPGNHHPSPGWCHEHREESPLWVPRSSTGTRTPRSLEHQAYYCIAIQRTLSKRALVSITGTPVSLSVLSGRFRPCIDSRAECFRRLARNDFDKLGRTR